MSNNVIFISEKYLRQFSPVPLNLSSKLISQSIINMQAMYIKPCLGDELYDRIVDEVEDEDISPEIVNLTPFIKQALVWFVMYDLVRWSSLKITDDGVVKGTSAKSSTSSQAELADMQRNCKVKSDFFVKELYNFLKDNSEDYPEWKCKGGDCNYSRRITVF